MPRRKKVIDAEDNTKHAFSSGATSSEHIRPYHLIPFPTIVGEADRFGIGAQNHGDVNYQKCITFSQDGRVKILDLEFVRDRYNHLIDHLYVKLRKDGETEYNKGGLKVNGSNIDAALWGITFVKWIAAHGFDWKRILNPYYVSETQMGIPTEAADRVKNPIYWIKTRDGKCYKYNSKN